ncbi:MAG: type VI secretion system baseplate subunit TssG [Litoreibacter sp.]
MAHDARHPRADLAAADMQIERMDFFRMLALLESEGRRFGRSGGPAQEPARLGQSARLSFAAQDVAELLTETTNGATPQVVVNVLGLLGPEGPMPLHMTRWVMQRMSNRWFAGDSAGALADTSFLDFINILQHRMLAFYWRAWADARPEIQLVHGDGGRVSAMLRAFSGLGLPGTITEDARIDGAKLRHATDLVQNSNGPERLTAFVATVIGVPVTLAEFVGHWVLLPDKLQSRIGAQHCGLGTGAVVGARSFDRMSRAELRIGPLSLKQFTDFLENPTVWAQLRHAVIAASGKELDFDLRLVLAANDVPAATLGQCQLGRTSWLAPSNTTDRDDLCFSTVTRDMATFEREAAAA